MPGRVLLISDLGSLRFVPYNTCLPGVNNRLTDVKMSTPFFSAKNLQRNFQRNPRSKFFVKLACELAESINNDLLTFLLLLSKINSNKHSYTMFRIQKVILICKIFRREVLTIKKEKKTFQNQVFEQYST